MAGHGLAPETAHGSITMFRNSGSFALVLGLVVQNSSFAQQQTPQPSSPFQPPLGFPNAAPRTDAVVPVDLRQPASGAAISIPKTAWARLLEQDPRALTPLVNQTLHASRRGADWLARANTTKGLFTPGLDPATATEIPGSPLGQVQAAWALAKASAAFGDERYEMRALQALLACLEDTTEDAEDPQARHSSAPSAVVSRPAGTATLLVAIASLEKPPAELLDKAEALARYLCKPAVLASLETVSKADPSITALVSHALLVSHRHRPAPWKLEAARKAFGINLTAEALQKAMPWPLIAAAEMSRHDPSFTSRVHALSETLLATQIDKLDPRHPEWFGGWSAIQTIAGAEPAQPTCSATANALMALAEAAAVTRRDGDLNRHQRLKDAMDRGTQFLLQLQYTDANTQHFADWYRPRLTGGFRPGPKDTVLCLEQNHGALMALLGCARDSAP